jgi:hypothetical protein
MNKSDSLDAPAAVAIAVAKVRDAHILRSVLSEQQPNVARFFAAEEGMSVISLARNILVQEPIAVVLAYDSGGENVEKLHRELSSLLGSLASAARFRVVVFEPSLADIAGDLDIGQNGSIPEEKKQKLRRDPQIQAFLLTVAKMRLVMEKAAQAFQGQMPVGETRATGIDSCNIATT